MNVDANLGLDPPANRSTIMAIVLTSRRGTRGVLMWGRAPLRVKGCPGQHIPIGQGKRSLAVRPSGYRKSYKAQAYDVQHSNRTPTAYVAKHYNPLLYLHSTTKFAS